MAAAMGEAQPLSLHPPLEKIVEVCGVYNVQQEPPDANGVQLLRCHTILPGLPGYDVALQPDQVAVLRFAGLDPDTPEYIKVVNGKIEDFSEEYFTDASRRSLAILNPERARRHEAYLSPEREKLERIIGRRLVHPSFRAHRRLASPQERTERYQTLIDRQFGVMWRIANLAAADTLLDIYEPETARARALGSPFSHTEAAPPAAAS